MINKEKFEDLYNYLAISDKPEKADLIFVFGGISMPEVWQKALDLYKSGYAKTIYIAGGLGRKSKEEKINKSEAETIKEFLLKNNVTSGAIITELNSTNTLENIVNADKVLKSANKIIAVSKPFHMRRVLATFAKQYPDLIVMSCPPNFDYDTLSNDNKQYFFDRMQGETEKLKIYADKGDIKSQT